MGLILKDVKIVVGNFQLGPVSAEFGDTGLYLIRGQNGAGKSTLLRGLIGRIRRQSGAVSGLKFPVGTVGLESLFFTNWTVHENADWIANLLGLPIKVPREIESLAPQKFSHLSQGLKRQVELSLMLSLQLPTAFLDEPLAPLDRKQRELYAQKIQESAKKSLVVLTTHFEEELFGTPAGIVQL